MRDDTEERPDPDALLASIQKSEDESGRGKLKIFFGACAGDSRKPMAARKRVSCWTALRFFRSGPFRAAATFTNLILRRH